MPKSEYLQVYGYLTRRRPACFDRIRNEWLNDEETQWPGSFERWLFEKVQNESEELCQDCSEEKVKFTSDCDMELCEKCYSEHYSGSCGVCRNF